MSSKTQELCADFVRHIWPNETVLIDHRPIWLHGMELDIYLPALQLAFEFQGVQHYYFVPAFHPTIEDFYALKKRDIFKRQLCRRNNVHLSNIRFDDKRVLWGLQQKLRNQGFKATASPGLKAAWLNHKKVLRRFNEEARFRPRKFGVLCPMNGAASRLFDTTPAIEIHNQRCLLDNASSRAASARVSSDHITYGDRPVSKRGCQSTLLAKVAATTGETPR